MAREDQLRIEFEPKTNQEYFYDFFAEIEEKQSVEKLLNGKRFIFCFVKKIDENISVIQFGRQQDTTIYHLGDQMIEGVSDVSFPFIYIIVDFKKQIILIESKPSVYQHVQTAKGKLCDIFEHYLHSFGILIDMENISSGIEFWKKVDTLKEIYELKLELPPPNLFKTRDKASDVVKETHDLSNFSKFLLVLRNKNGGLKVVKDNFISYINLIAKGGGSYSLKYRENGINDKIGNFDYIKKKAYDISDIKEMDPEKLKGDLDDLNKPEDEEDMGDNKE